MYHIFLSFVVALCLGTHWAVAATTSGEIANSLNELAQQGFAIKQLVFEINSTADAGPIPVSGSLGAQMTAHNGIQDIYTEMDTMGAVILTDVKYITNTPIITGQTEQQDVYEGYSNVSGWPEIGHLEPWSHPYLMTLVRTIPPRAHGRLFKQRNSAESDQLNHQRQSAL